MRIRERIHSFGPTGSLVGIVSLPPGDAGSDTAGDAHARPFVVLLNAGLVHRIGPFALSAGLARRLAERGHRVLRFDQAGLGDSSARPGAGTSDAAAVLDARDAMDSLHAAYGAQRFVVGGLCSGAMNAHRIALADARVVGVCLLDGYAYPTRSYYREIVKRKLARPRSWLATAGRVLARASGELNQWRRGAPEVVPDGAERPASREALFFQDWPARADAHAEVEAILLRGTRMLFVYSGGWSSFVAAEQFDEMFPRLQRRQQVTVRYHRHADHTYVVIDHREAMFQDIEQFLRAISQPGSVGGPPSLS